MLGDLGVLDDFGDPVADELRDGVVRVLAEDQVVVAAEQADETVVLVVPDPPVIAVALLLGHLHRALGRLGEGDTESGLAVGLARLGVTGLRRPLLNGVERMVVRGYHEIGRALEHRQLRGLLRDERNDLHTRGRRTDHRDPFPGEVDALLRPVRRVVMVAAETLQPGYLRDPGRRQAAARHDQVLGGHPVAAVGAHVPPSRALVEHGLGHPGPEPDVTAQAEPVGDVVDISEQLLLGRVLGRGRPVASTRRMCASRPTGRRSPVSSGP
ncbi:hypothetical protein [Actinomadura sp. KC345]|uniref:hypothetical protein n=1 Tax=Actinomadura sp. KC345 TaxID=2530371 RepID=UPI001FB5C655|nr:hypothetical protein [Actinomadura sp. KC345]